MTRDGIIFATADTKSFAEPEFAGAVTVTAGGVTVTTWVDVKVVELTSVVGVTDGTEVSGAAGADVHADKEISIVNARTAITVFFFIYSPAFKN